MTEKMAIVLFSGTVDKILAAGIITSGAIAMDMDVDIFLSFWGLAAFHKDMAGKDMRMSKDFKDMAPMFLKAMQKKNIPSWYDTLKKAKGMGNVKIHACSMTMDVMEWKKGDFVDLVDDVIGVGSFIGMASDAKMTLFI